MPIDRITLKKWLRKLKDALEGPPYTFSREEIIDILRRHGTNDYHCPPDMVDQVIRELYR